MCRLPSNREARGEGGDHGTPGTEISSKRAKALESNLNRKKVGETRQMRELKQGSNGVRKSGGSLGDRKSREFREAARQVWKTEEAADRASRIILNAQVHWWFRQLTGLTAPFSPEQGLCLSCAH